MINQANRSKFRMWKSAGPDHRGLTAMICDVCLTKIHELSTDIVFSVSPVSKGRIAWKILRNAPINNGSGYGAVVRPYTSIRDKEYIEWVDKVLSSEDPDNPLLALFRTFT
jgi:hypothetical protein